MWLRLEASVDDDVELVPALRCSFGTHVPPPPAKASGPGKEQDGQGYDDADGQGYSLAAGPARAAIGFVVGRSCAPWAALSHAWERIASAKC